MSTIPNRRTNTAADMPVVRPVKKRNKGGASFRYGYRYAKVTQPNGRATWEMVPLTLLDVLHPQFGDVHVLSDPHGDDTNYLKDAFRDRYKSEPSVVVLSDCGIFWDVPRLKHHSPDLAVIFGVKRRKEWKTFHVKTEKVRPVLIIEVTSPSTRTNDVKHKVKQYARAKVPHYVIADAVEKGQKRRLTLIGYKLNGKAYERMAADKNGRIWLEPVGLWLGVRADRMTGGERVALFDPVTNEEIGDYTALSLSRAEALERAEAEASARVRAEEQARAATEQANAAIEQANAATEQAAAEAQARAQAEGRTRELEAELQRLRRRSRR